MKIRISPILSVLAVAFLTTESAYALPHELSPPPGPPGAVMKSLDKIEPRAPISELPFTITESGSYYMTGNLTGIAGENGITIAAGVGNVTIDLMGFTLQGVEGSLNGIILADTLGQADNITIRNGIITDFGQGGISIRYGTGRLIEKMHISGNGGVGVRVFGAGAIFRQSTISMNGGIGIWVAGGGIIDSCTVTGNENNGILGEEGLLIKNCAVSHNGGGISAGVGARISNTGAHRNEHYGIDVSLGSTISFCTATGNKGDGIRLSGPGGIPGIGPAGQSIFVTNSSSDNNEGAGIRISRAAARIEGNHLSRNSIGIQAESTGNLIINNSAAGNTEANYVISDDNEVGPIGTMSNVGHHPKANFSSTQ